MLTAPPLDSLLVLLAVTNFLACLFFSSHVLGESVIGLPRTLVAPDRIDVGNSVGEPGGVPSVDHCVELAESDLSSRRSSPDESCAVVALLLLAPASSSVLSLAEVILGRKPPPLGASADANRRRSSDGSDELRRAGTVFSSLDSCFHGFS